MGGAVKFIILKMGTAGSVRERINIFFRKLERIWKIMRPRRKGRS